MPIPRLVEFARSFAGWDRIKSRALYTGFVAEHDLSHAGQATKADVRKAAAKSSCRRAAAPSARRCCTPPSLARPKTALADRTWRLLVGANMPAAERAALAAARAPTAKES